MSGSTKGPAPERGPLVLGSGGRVGRMFRRLAAQGLWPGPEPLWHTRDGREGTLGWDLHDRDLPAWRESLPPVTGIIVLAGQTREDPSVAHDADERKRITWLGSANEAPVLAAQDLARDRGIGPILMCSSAAIYGTAPQPCREDGPLQANTIYGRAKIWMEEETWVERLTQGRLPICALRIGNVAGADALFGAMAEGPVTLDRLPDGTAPRRAYIGPLTLARALVALLAAPDLPGVATPMPGPEPTGEVERFPAVNLAQPGLLPMSDLLDAAGVPFAWRPAPPTALPALEMDLSRLQALAPLPPATPEGLVAEARLAGWRPFGDPP